MNDESDKISRFTDLNAWKQGHVLVLMIYETTKHFPKNEEYSLTNQVRRCAISITSNIAEGFSRSTYKNKVQFYSIALGSLTELQNQLIIAKDVQYLEERQFRRLFDQSTIVHKLINGLLKSSKRYYA